MSAMVSQPAAQPLALFPLRSVLFPGALLPLKVFEARYLDLVANCLRESRPFGVVCLREGGEVGSDGVLFERQGVLARIDDVDAEQAGILRIHCTGTLRFRFEGQAHQVAGGLWQVDGMQALPDDPQEAPEAVYLPTVQALSAAILALRDQGSTPFAEPYRLDDAGWVANRWCEILPIPLAAKQRLMLLLDPQLRLRLVDEYLRSKGVLGALG